jgi:ATP-dependent Clp protease ATP-binding subunit ClpC
MFPGRTPDPHSNAVPLSDTASGVLEFAKNEATALNHHYIGTEHILLGFMRHADSYAAALLGSRTDLQSLRTAVADMFGVGSAAPASLRLPFTPRAANVFRLAQQEAEKYSHPQLTPEHLLLGILREGEGAAAQILMRLGFDLGDLISDVSRSFHSGTD